MSKKHRKKKYLWGIWYERQRESGRRNERNRRIDIRKAERCERGKCSYKLLLKIINLFLPVESLQANYPNSN